jgi:hypothetical protein
VRPIDRRGSKPRPWTAMRRRVGARRPGGSPGPDAETSGVDHRGRRPGVQPGGARRARPMRSGSASSHVRTQGQTLANGSTRVRQSRRGLGARRWVARTSPCCHAVAKPGKKAIQAALVTRRQMRRLASLGRCESRAPAKRPQHRASKSLRRGLIGVILRAAQLNPGRPASTPSPAATPPAAPGDPSHATSSETRRGRRWSENTCARLHVDVVSRGSRRRGP